MSRTAIAPAESYATFWDEAPIEVAEEVEMFEEGDPYAEFSSAAGDEAQPDAADAV